MRLIEQPLAEDYTSLSTRQLNVETKNCYGNCEIRQLVGHNHG